MAQRHCASTLTSTTPSIPPLISRLSDGPAHPTIRDINVAPGSLGAIVRAFKSAVVRRINTLRGTPGESVWQRNYYEHIIRNKERLKTKWAQLEAIVAAPRRLELLVKDIVEHFERRLETLEGKGMIVCMSCRIAVELYREIVRLRPEWEDLDEERGWIKVVMTGSTSDPADWQPHIRDKRRREALANCFRGPNDPFKLVIVRDMWTTDFDASSLHTMYLD